MTRGLGVPRCVLEALLLSLGEWVEHRAASCEQAALSIVLQLALFVVCGRREFGADGGEERAQLLRRSS